MKLYEIADKYENIIDKTFDQETGEINEVALSSLDEVTKQIEEKGIAIASYIKNLDAEREAINQAKKNMAERENALDKKADYLTQYLQSNMERCGINEIKSPYFNIRLKKCPISTDIINEEFIPDKYKKVKEVVSIDKLKIKADILAGIEIAGAALRQNNRLEIK